MSQYLSRSLGSYIIFVLVALLVGLGVYLVKGIGGEKMILGITTYSAEDHAEARKIISQYGGKITSDKSPGFLSSTREWKLEVYCGRITGEKISERLLLYLSCEVKKLR